MKIGLNESSKEYIAILKICDIVTIHDFANQSKVKKLFEQLLIILNNLDIDHVYMYRELIDELIDRISNKEFSRIYPKERNFIVSQLVSIKTDLLDYTTKHKKDNT